MTEQNQYTGAFPTVYDVVSRPQDNIVLSYGTSDNNAISVLAFRVERAIRRIERVTNGPAIPDGDTVDFGYFGENGHSSDVSDPGDELFRIDANRNRTLVEYGFALPVADDVYVAIEAGDGKPITGFAEGSDRERGFGVNELDQRGAPASQETYVVGDADTEVPTTRLSPAHTQGLVRVDSRQDGNNPFRFGFKNNSGQQITANIIGMGTTYEVRPIYDEGTVLDMLEGDGYKRRLLTYGAFGNTKPNLPRDWNDAKTTVNFGDVGPAFNPP